jgi:isoquinoline 1-oxidoreductase alpha subunit
MATLQLNVNGQNYQVNVNNSSMPLLWVLRDLIGLTGTKYGCGIEVCGACTVLIDGQREHSCVFDVSSAVGKKIVTIEGLSADSSHPAQKAWVANQVPQCGYCQSGMIMSVAGAMQAGHTGNEILPEVQNLCVCGTYQRIRQAVATLGK